MKKTTSEDSNLISTDDQNQVKLYASRWLILLTLSVISFTNAMLWISFGPITNLTVAWLDVSDLAVNMLSLVFCISTIVCFYPGIVLISKIGLRAELIVSGIINVTACCIRFISTISALHSFDTLKFVLMLIGQLVATLAQPLVVFTSTLLAASWFPPDQRALANGIGAMSNPLGIMVSSLISPLFVYKLAPSSSAPGVNSASGSSSHSSSSISSGSASLFSIASAKEHLRVQFRNLTLFHLALAVFGLICALAFVRRSRPKHPPVLYIDGNTNVNADANANANASEITPPGGHTTHTNTGPQQHDTAGTSFPSAASSSSTTSSSCLSRSSSCCCLPCCRSGSQHDHEHELCITASSSPWQQILYSLRNRQFLLLMMLVGAGIGMFTTLSTIMQQILCVHGYTNQVAGNASALLFGIGIFGALIVSVVIDRKPEWFVDSLKFSCSFALIALIGFSLLTNLPNITWAIYLSVALSGFFGFALYAVSLELGVEITYPAIEPVSTGLLMTSGQVFSIIFVLSAQVFTISRDPLSQPEFADNTCLSLASDGVLNATSSSSSFFSTAPIDDYMVAPLFYSGVQTLLLTIFFFTFRPRLLRRALEVPNPQTHTQPLP